MDATSLACVGSGGERGGERGTGRPDLGIGVIGVGGRGTLARLAHKPGAGSRVVACCDVDADELARQSRRYVVDGAEPPLLTRDVAELLASERVDAVFICTPDFCHEGQAVAALEAGKAVYLEKPLAITTEGCDRILATAARRRGKLYVGHNMRHMTFVQKMRELIQSGAIGKVEAVLVRHFVGHGGDFYFKDWHADRRNTGSLLLQKGAHDIDVIHHLCGGRAVRVHAMGKLAVYGGCKRREAPADAADWRGAKASRAVENASIQNWPPASQAGLNPVVDVEDVSLMNMELDTGVLATYSQVHFTPMYWRNYAVIGRRGMLENFGDTGEGAVVKLWNQRSVGYRADADAEYAVGGDAADHGGSDVRIVEDFLQFARGDGPAAGASPVDARASVAAGVAATASLRAGGVPVDVPPPDAAVARYFAT